MNRENVLRVAQAIEDAAKPEANPEIGFNMVGYVYRASDHVGDKTGHGCGTVCCIAGWARAVENPKRAAMGWTGDTFVHPEGSDYERACRFLGINENDATRLFLGGDLSLSEITPAQAVTVLRRLADTGVVDWSAAA